MPGIPTKFIIAELVFERLKADKKLPAELKNEANLPFFYLGAIGASFGDLISARPELGSSTINSTYFKAWLPIMQLLADIPSTPSSPGVYSNLKQLRHILSKLNLIINLALAGGALEKDAAKISLVLMMDELNSLQTIIQGLTNSVNNLTNLRTSIGSNILKSSPAEKKAPNKSWQVRDILHQSQTGEFLKQLHKTAINGQQKAYALGSSISYSADLCGNPYINSIVGGPYRNDWWRHRWINNYVDTWVYGYYKQGGAASVFIDSGNKGVPNPLYTNWPNVTEANLQKKIELPGLSADELLANISSSQPVLGILPPDFVDFWLNAYKTTYSADNDRVNVEGLQSAYSMTWLILWIETSGEVFPAVPPDQINYPDNCGPRPSWIAVDGSVAVGTGTVATPPQPSKDTDPSVAEVISGIVLALIGVAAWIGIGLAAAFEAFVGAAVLIADGVTDPDWDKLRCDVQWSLAYVQNFTNIMHELLTWGGFGFPYTLSLTHDAITYEGSGRTQIVPPDAALATVRSRGADAKYPASRWKALKSNWANFPTEAREEYPVLAYPRDPIWPFHFVDGFQPTNPPALPKGARVGIPNQINALFSLAGRPALVRDKIEFDSRKGQLNFPQVSVNFFGNAVDVSLELILNVTPAEFETMDLDFLNWDLDGDPGIEFPTWLLPYASAPRTASIPE